MYNNLSHVSADIINEWKVASFVLLTFCKNISKLDGLFFKVCSFENFSGMRMYSGTSQYCNSLASFLFLSQILEENNNGLNFEAPFVIYV